MAITKKAEAIQAAKLAERQRITALQAKFVAIRDSGTAKVPKHVVNGSYQQAVDFKAEIDGLLSRAHRLIAQPGNGNSLVKLQRIARRIETAIAKLCASADDPVPEWKRVEPKEQRQEGFDFN